MPYARLLGRKGEEFCPKDVDIKITSIPAFIGKADLLDSIGFERMGNRVQRSPHNHSLTLLRLHVSLALPDPMLPTPH